MKIIQKRALCEGVNAFLAEKLRIEACEPFGGIDVFVNECNKRFWQMPFACSTTRISDDLRVSRQTVITAREHLVKRRLISLTEGKSRHLPSTQQIREHYGDRIADRLNEMVKKIVFSNGTYRTDKLATSG